MTAPLRLIFAAIAMSTFALVGSHTSAQDAPITFSGLVFVDAAVASNPSVEVRVGQVPCSQPGTPIPAPEGAAPADANRYLITVTSGRERSGCPTIGATLTILVNGRAANQSPVLTAGSHNIDLFVGPDLAVYSGVIEGDAPPAGSSVTARVDSTTCGFAAITAASQSGPPEYRFLIVPATCAGSARVLTFDIAGITVLTGVPWSSGVSSRPLTFHAAPPSKVVPPNTGNGGYLPQVARTVR